MLGGPRRWSSGSTKAAVLPVPVWALAMRSAGEHEDRLGLDGVGWV